MEIFGNNATIAMDKQTETNLVVMNDTWPYTTGVMSNTYSATENYRVACLNACYGEKITFSSCDASQKEDTYVGRHLTLNILCLQPTAPNIVCILVVTVQSTVKPQ